MDNTACLKSGGMYEHHLNTAKHLNNSLAWCRVPARQQPRFRRKKKKSVLFVQVFAGKMGTFTSSVCAFGLLALLACTSASSDVFDSVLGNTASCHKSCEMTYSLHTYPRVSTPLDGESNVWQHKLANLTFSDLAKKQPHLLFNYVFFVVLGFFCHGEPVICTKVECASLFTDTVVWRDIQLVLRVVLQEEELYACQRGCRLFSICQFVRDSEDLNQTKSECESSKLHPERFLSKVILPLTVSWPL